MKSSSYPVLCSMTYTMPVPQPAGLCRAPSPLSNRGPACCALCLTRMQEDRPAQQSPRTVAPAPAAPAARCLTTLRPTQPCSGMAAPRICSATTTSHQPHLVCQVHSLGGPACQMLPTAERLARAAVFSQEVPPPGSGVARSTGSQVARGIVPTLQDILGNTRPP